MTQRTPMERLADKLAAADLDDEETALLISLLAGSNDEVAGYRFTASATELPGTSHKRWIDVLSIDWGTNRPGG